MTANRRAERLALPVAGLVTAALLVVMLYYPVATVLVEAIRPEGRVTLDPLLAVLSDPFYVGALAGAVQDPAGIPTGLAAWARSPSVPAFGLFGFTAWQAFLSTLASLALGLPGAYLLARFEFPGRRTVESLTAVPFVLPSIMVAVGFVAAFGANGALNDLLRLVGLPTFDLLFTLEIIVLAHAFYNAPLVTRIVAASWESVDARAVETARSLGASPLRAFRDVVVPQLLPAILTGALLTFIFTFMSFPIILALGGLKLATVEVWLFDRVQQLKLTEAAALAVLETVVSLALTYAYLRYESQSTGTDRSVSPLARERLFGGFDLKRGALLAYGVVVVVVFLLPLVSMVAESVTAASGTGFTTQYYGYLLEREAAQVTVQTKPGIAVRNSLLFGVGTLLLAVPMGVVIAFVTTRDSVLSRVLGTASMLPFAVSGIVIGLGLLDGLVFGIEVGGVRLAVVGPVAIVAAHAIGAYPFVVRNVAPLLGDLDRRLVESARALGATRARALVDVELPLVAPGLAAGAAFAFAISIGEFDSTVILAEGSRAYTMPVAVERFLTDRTLGPATAMGTVLLVVTAAAFVVIDRVGGRYRE
ncbi:ABC transporter permease [Halorarius litoreus]|uniref:ABC transporter permease n=1 Tax=Halorarius litoreus TaxID=2962676 RepID=UPI0020CD1063|nr:iron ABC transporter permease [Halorarius litoreus]